MTFTKSVLAITLVGLGIFLFLVATHEAEASDFYQWTDSAGAISFTDDESRIPAAFKEAVEVIRIEGLKSFEQGSIVAPSTYAVDLEARLTHLRSMRIESIFASRQRPRDCTGHVFVTSERFQIGDYNRRFYTVFDECGRVVSVTRSRPAVQINR